MPRLHVPFVVLSSEDKNPDSVEESEALHFGSLPT